MSVVYCRSAARRAATTSLCQRQSAKILSSSNATSSFGASGRKWAYVTSNLQNTALYPQSQRTFSASVAYPESIMENGVHEQRMPLTLFTEDEEMVREAARHWANEELRPLVRDMDNEGKTRTEIIQGLFDHGFMGMVSVF